MGVGIAIGAGLGVAFDNLSIGIGLGVVFGALLARLKDKKDTQNKN